jgi:hypothetical protein
VSRRGLLAGALALCAIAALAALAWHLSRGGGAALAPSVERQLDEVAAKRPRSYYLGRRFEGLALRQVTGSDAFTIYSDCVNLDRAIVGDGCHTIVLTQFLERHHHIRCTRQAGGHGLWVFLPDRLVLLAGRTPAQLTRAAAKLQRLEGTAVTPPPCDGSHP